MSTNESWQTSPTTALTLHPEQTPAYSLPRLRSTIQRLLATQQLPSYQPVPHSLAAYSLSTASTLLRLTRQWFASAWSTASACQLFQQVELFNKGK